jgi:two-component system response regulator MprA
MSDILGKKSMHILVVDDDPQILDFVKRGLAYEGYTVETASDGLEALGKAEAKAPDLVLLDVMMPEIDGIEVARRLRQSSDVPILMLTAKGTVADRVAGLDSGADDYLVKPFAFDELLARMRALLRRRQPAEGEVLRFADVVLDTGARQVTRGQHIVELTTQEFDLLELLMRHPRQVLKRDQIYEKVWGYDFGGESNVLEVYIRYLRSKLEVNGEPRLIRTVRGVGYVLRE